jgi:hypothetical protein
VYLHRQLGEVDRMNAVSHIVKCMELGMYKSYNSCLEMLKPWASHGKRTMVTLSNGVVIRCSNPTSRRRPWCTLLLRRPLLLQKSVTLSLSISLSQFGTLYRNAEQKAIDEPFYHYYYYILLMNLLQLLLLALNKYATTIINTTTRSR